jgi:hypothetical protein
MEVRRQSMMHAEVSAELRPRGVIRSSNNPIGDLAEHLFCRDSGWKQAPSSKRDAERHGGRPKRYLIKDGVRCRTTTRGSSGRCAIFRPKALMCALRFYFKRIVEFSWRRSTRVIAARRPIPVHSLGEPRWIFGRLIRQSWRGTA